MAVEDPTAKHGLKLTIEDYPFANDGMMLWEAIKQWVTDYVNNYYKDASKVVFDNELQAWWEDVRTKGHEDKKDEPWWPVLKTQQDLIQVLTTIIWVTSGHHAAVNFGQYVFGGYFPNRPTIARINMPTEEPTESEFELFLNKPELTLLKCFPSQQQATKVMAILDVLSNHSPDEEYIGDTLESSWEADPVIKAAYERFSTKKKNKNFKKQKKEIGKEKKKKKREEEGDRKREEEEEEEEVEEGDREGEKEEERMGSYQLNL
uniref:Lipoxygenase domain-containing protein n=1 Tax=Manihot esculenta TaxID=3983 RepID=A0A2C9VDI1_MANES